MIDELQISDKAINSTYLVKSYFDSFALRICEIPTVHGKVSIFNSVKSVCDTVQRRIIVKTAKIAIDNNLTITLNLEIESNASGDATVLMATDRLTKLYPIHLNVGNNNVIFEYTDISARYPSWYEREGRYLLHLNKPRIILIDGNKIVYNQYLSIWNLEFTNIVFLVLILVITVMFCLLSLNWNKKLNNIW